MPWSNASIQSLEPHRTCRGKTETTLEAPLNSVDKPSLAYVDASWSIRLDASEPDAIVAADFAGINREDISAPKSPMSDTADQTLILARANDYQSLFVGLIENTHPELNRDSG